MTGDSFTPEQPPSGPLYARQSDETPKVGTRRGAGATSGPQTGAESLDPRLRAYAAVFTYIQQLPAETTYLDPVTRNAVIWRAVHAALDVTDPEPEQSVPTPLRDRYAAAIASYDHAVGLAIDPAPRDHHYGQADAALAVRDRELEQLRAQVAWMDASVQQARQDAAARDQALEQLRARVRHVADLIAACAPWTANLEDTAARVRAAAEAEGQGKCRRCRCPAGSPDCQHCNCCDVPDQPPTA